MLNNVVINPALISTKSKNEINIMARDQWTGFEGAPKTQSISYLNIAHDRYNGGVSLLNDMTGPISMIEATITGSTIIPTKINNKISIGLDVNIHRYSINNNELILENDGIIDPVINTNSMEGTTGLSSNIGVNYFYDKFRRLMHL
mgnify:FL=1